MDIILVISYKRGCGLGGERVS